ncbi:hypothetical protein Agub_g7234, partial [Astrephomene gubernaculifera]
GQRGGGEGEEEEEEEAGPMEILVDAFRSGEVCYLSEAADRISELVGSAVRIDPRVLQESRPLPPRTFLLRLLSNLRNIYLTTQQVDPLLDVIKFMRATLEEPGAGDPHQQPASSKSSKTTPKTPSSSPSAGLFFPAGSFFSSPAASAALARDEGLCYFALRRYPEAAEALREYLRLAEEAARAAAAESEPPPLPAEEVHTVAAVLREAARRMRQQGGQGGEQQGGQGGGPQPPEEPGEAGAGL